MGALEISALIVGLLRVGVDAWQAFTASGVEAALKILDDGLREGRGAVAEMRTKLAANDAKADADLDAKFPAPSSARVALDGMAEIAAALNKNDGGPSER